MANIRRYQQTVQLDSGLIIPANAAAGATLQSDAEGHATWQVSGAARQNLRVPELTPAWAASSVNVPLLEGTLTIDGYVTEVGNIVLLTAQTEAKNNGLWQVEAGAWKRPTEFTTGFELKAARKTLVLKGATNKQKIFFLNYTEPVIIGATAQEWLPLPSGSEPEAWKPIEGLAANWTNPRAAYHAVEYRKDRGMVQLRGTLERTTAAYVGTTTIFTLPAGYRPSTLVAPQMASNSPITTKTPVPMVTVKTGGEVVLVDTTETNLPQIGGLVSFDGVEFAL